MFDILIGGNKLPKRSEHSYFNIKSYLKLNSIKVLNI